jgi:hypothetical protein
MGPRTLAAAVATLLALLATGCGAGTTTVQRTVTVTTQAPRAPQSLIYARRTLEGARRELGERVSPRGCAQAPGGRVKTVHVYSVISTCVRVSPRDRLLFINSTGIGRDHREPNPVEISLGAYSAFIGIGQSALFPAPAGSYLRLGLHEADTSASAQQPSVLVLPEGCAIEDPKPGEGLCFATGAPPCPSPSVKVRVGRTGIATGTIYQPFDLVNDSSRTCSVSGFPRVVAVDAAARPIGPPGTADHLLTTMSGNHPKTIALTPGGVAIFEMRYGEALNLPQPCGIRKARALRIAITPSGPPQTVPYQMELCRRQSFDVGRIE